MSTPTEDGHVRLSSIADDILRKTLTFLTPADCTRGPAAASKAMRVVASTANRQRYVDSYVLLTRTVNGTGHTGPAGSERNVFTGAERASGEEQRSDERRKTA